MKTDEAREQLKPMLKNYIEKITQKSKGHNMYICPLCGSGTGKSGTGAFSIQDGTKWKCFSCNKGGDIFDIIGEYEGIADNAAQLKRASELFGSHTDYSRSTVQNNKTETKPESFKDFFLQAHSHINETDYPEQRGLSKDIINRFKLGYVAEWRHPKAPNAPASPRLIIPITEYTYLARDTRAEVPEEQKQYKKSKAKGADQVSWTFNRKALKEAQKPIFIVEGEIDALSIIDVGGEAIALGSIAYIRAFIELLKTERPEQPLIIALDNETDPEKKAKIEKAITELEKGLQELKIPFYRVNISGEYKDANEAFMADRETFILTIGHAETHYKEAQKEAEKAEYLKTSAANHIEDFLKEINDFRSKKAISTGFKNLDTFLNGGFYEGLYIIGAISSLGKTTLVLQIADHAAQSDTDVLIFHLEQSKKELMAKSISRLTVKENDLSRAMTAKEIMIGAESGTLEKTAALKEAIEAYKGYANNIYITEGIGDIGAADIKKDVIKHIEITGRKPLVIVDYLQILAPYNDRATDKQNTDKSVLELKRMSRDYNIPVLAVSSFNRENYTKEVDMEAFKESGAIEYSCDVLIGLQFEGAGKGKINLKAKKKEKPRKIELEILKNRNGEMAKIKYEYYSAYNYFKEGQIVEEE